MSEQPSVETVEAPSADAPQVQAPSSLDEVYSQYNVEAAPAPTESATHQPAYGAPAPTAHPTPQATPVAQAPAPDPIEEPAAWAAWQAEQLVQQRLAPLESSLSEVYARDAARQAAETQAKQNADINAAVKTVMDEVGEGANRDISLGFLAVKMHEDPKFRALFGQKDDNPAAWNAALKVIAKNLKQSSTARLDPQTAEDQRAVQASFSGRQPAQTGMSEDHRNLLNAPKADFDRFWNNR